MKQPSVLCFDATATAVSSRQAVRLTHSAQMRSELRLRSRVAGPKVGHCTCLVLIVGPCLSFNN
jgi:hypothetical protein